jgi:hypothetical protein
MKNVPHHNRGQGQAASQAGLPSYGIHAGSSIPLMPPNRISHNQNKSSHGALNQAGSNEPLKTESTPNVGKFSNISINNNLASQGNPHGSAHSNKLGQTSKPNKSNSLHHMPVQN